MTAGARSGLPLAAGSARLGVALTMMSPNCSGLLSRPSVSSGNWNGCERAAGRLADLPGRRIEILAADRVGHVDGGHVVRGQLLRIEPGANAVVALALVGDVRHAVDAEQFVLDVDRGVIAEIDVVVAAVRAR